MARGGGVGRAIEGLRHGVQRDWDNALRVSEFKVIESLNDFFGRALGP
jgi:hypothetical protein